MGTNCNTSSSPCDLFKPCQNNGTCINTNTTSTGYICTCPHGFDGEKCEYDHRPCKPDTCWHGGMFFSPSSIISKIYFIFQEHAPRHQIRHLIVHVYLDGLVITVKQ